MGIAHSADIFNLIGQGLEILELTAAILYVLQHLSGPGQPFATGSTETTGFMGEEANQIKHHAHRTGLIVENNQGAGAHTASGFANDVVVHG